MNAARKTRGFWPTDTRNRVRITTAGTGILAVSPETTGIQAEYRLGNARPDGDGWAAISRPFWLRTSSSSSQLAKIIGTSSSQVSMVEHDQSGTSLQTAMAAAKALDISLDYLVGWVDEPTPTRTLVFDLKDKIARLRDVKVDEEHGLSYEDHDYVGINEIDAVAGAGAVVQDERIQRRIKFPWNWLRRHGLKAHLSRIIRVSGESMEPTLPDGCAILVYQGSQERRDGKIFVIRIGEEIIVKRVIHDPEAGWVLVSDNPDKTAWPTRAWPDDAIVVGEVKWLGRTFT